MYAIVTTGGKQVKVAPGDVVRVEKIDAPVGETVELGTVCLLSKDNAVVVDRQALAGAKVMGLIMRQGKLKKVRVFKKKRRKNYARLHGHRQLFTELKIQDILS
jgi:large subunit ribosomal protein L21